MIKSFCRRALALSLVSGFVVYLLLGVNSGTLAQRPVKKRAVKQPFEGICGMVVMKRGNQMPTLNRPRSKGQPAEREILIYELTNQSQVQGTDDGFYQKVTTRLVKTVKSDTTGNFCVRLEPGQYSVFIREDKGLYANIFDGQNNISPVTVSAGHSSTIKLEITHGAVY